MQDSLHIERAILGSMMLDPIAINDATAKLVADDFSMDSHRRIYAAILATHEDGLGVDYNTVCETLRGRKELDAVKGSAYITSLCEGLPRHFNIESYVRIVKDKSLLRRMQSIFSTAATRAGDHGESASEVLSDTEALLAEISDASTERGFSSMADIVSGSFGSIDALYEKRNDVTGIATRYTEFDKMTGGLQGGELIIIAARPSMGKTAWAINIAQNVSAASEKVVAIFSLEMSKESLLKRMLASEAIVNGRAIQSGMIHASERAGLHRALERILGSKMFIDDSPSIGLMEMRAKSRRLKQQEGALDLIIIDYLQLMGSDSKSKRGAENRTQEVSVISRGLKALSKEMGCPVVALSQLSRDSESTADKRPMLRHLRESGSIEQDADVVAFIHRPEYYDRKDEVLKGKAEVILAKNRNGPTGTVHLSYQESCTRFSNLAQEEFAY